MWIKHYCGWLDRPAIMQLQTMRNGAKYVVILLKLRELAAQSQKPGVLLASQYRAMSVETLAKYNHCTKRTMESALKAFISLELVVQQDDGAYRLLGYEAEQNSARQAELNETPEQRQKRERREAAAERKRKSREKQAARVAEQAKIVTAMSQSCHSDVTAMSQKSHRQIMRKRPNHRHQSCTLRSSTS